MTMQQWVNVMRKAGCEIVYSAYEESELWYKAVKLDGFAAGYWMPKENVGSIMINGQSIMSWEFNK